MNDDYIWIVEFKDRRYVPSKVGNKPSRVYYGLIFVLLWIDD
jgi:hypothetical protein